MFRLFISVFLLLTVVSCLKTISKIEKILGSVKLHEFDTDFNSYVLTFNSTQQCPCTSHIYKLDPGYNVIFEWELNKTVKTITVTKEGDLYVTTADPANLLILRTNVSDFEELYPYYGKWEDKGIFLDDEDNLYHNSEKGVVILKYNETEPVVIKNLENVEITSNHATDCEGNVFMATADSRIAMISAEEATKPIPTAIFRDDILEKPDILLRIQTDEFNNLYFVLNNGVKKLTDGKLTKIINESPTDFCESENRIYVSDVTELNFSTYYKSQDEVVHSIEGFQYPVDLVRCDGSGNVFFGINTVNNENQIYVLKKGESSITKLNFPGTSHIYSMILDLNDNLVVVSHDVYYFPKGTIDSIKIPSGLPRARFHTAKLNEKMNDILIFKGTMLYVFK